MVADLAIKIIGLLATGGWAAIATTATPGGILGAVAEPVSGTIILGGALVLHLRASNNVMCANAIDKHRKLTAKAVRTK